MNGLNSENTGAQVLAESPSMLSGPNAAAVNSISEKVVGNGHGPESSP